MLAIIVGSFVGGKEAEAKPLKDRDRLKILNGERIKSRMLEGSPHEQLLRVMIFEPRKVIACI